ncbi:MAG: hypothetical protein RhofKO_41370 [Rhodothermales bacterium]
MSPRYFYGWAISLIVALISPSTSLAQQLLFSEAFSDDISTQWTVFGSPAAQRNLSTGNPAPSFDNNGDASYNSGALSTATFDYSEGLVIEADMYVPAAPNGCWVDGSFGLAESTTAGNSTWPGTVVRAQYLYSGALCHQDADPKDEGTLIFSIDLADGSSETFRLEQYNVYLDAWHRYKIVIRPDQRVAFYVDDTLYYLTTGTVTPDYQDMPLVLGGRSSSYGKVYHDNIAVRTVVDSYCLTDDTFSETDDLAALAIQQCGADATLADWNTIKERVGSSQDSLTAFYDAISLVDSGDDGVALVQRGGSRYFSGNRHYYIQRFDNGPYPSFEVHDQVGTLYLGSWYDLTFPILAETGASSSLIAHFPLDGDATDASGRGNNGTVNGATLTSDRFGNANSAYAFDGEDYIRVSDFDVALNDFTLSAWLRADDLPSWYRMPLAVHSGGGGINKGSRLLGMIYSNSLDLPYFAGTLTLSDGEESPGAQIQGFEPGQWYHAVFTREGTQQTLYLNGTEVATLTGSNGIYNISEGYFEIGAPNFWNGGWVSNGRAEAKWVGQIDDVRLYDRALSITEIEGLCGADGWACTAADKRGRIEVTTILDEFDETNTGAGCSLREAVQSFNKGLAFGGCMFTQLGTPNTVYVPSGTYLLTRSGADEDANVTGDLDILVPLRVEGENMAQTILDADELDRYLDFREAATAISLSGFIIQNGDLSAHAFSGQGPALYAAQGGGGVRINPTSVHDIEVVIQDVTLKDNTANWGAAFLLYSWDQTRDVNLSTDRLTISSNKTTRDGAFNVFTRDAYVDLIASNTAVSENQASGPLGTGIYVLADSATVNVATSTFRDNQGDWALGLDIQEHLDAAFTDVFFIDNTNQEIDGSVDPSGLFIGAGGASSESKIFLNDVQFKGNAGNGGGAFFESTGTVQIRESLFEDNVASLDISGGLYIQGASETLIENSVFRRNISAGASGGAVQIERVGDVILRGLSFEENVALEGAAAFVSSTGDISVSNTIVRNHTVLDQEFSWAPLYLKADSQVHVDSLSVYDNSFLEAAAFHLRAQAVTVRNSYVANNTTTSLTATADFQGESVIIQNTTFSNNHFSAPTEEDGQLRFSGGDIQLSNVTIVGNTAVRNAAALSGQPDSIYLEGSLIVDNTLTDGTVETCSWWNTPILTSGGYNILDTADDCPTGGPDDLIVAPITVYTTVLAETAEDNGGATLTHALLPGSPAIDRIPANALPGCTLSATDQRGQPRLQGSGCDVGALETTVDPADTDSDGITQAEENAVNSQQDGNGDGIPDGQQSHVTSLRNAVDGGYVTLVAEDASGNPLVLRNVQALDEGTIPQDAPSGVLFPLGLFSFDVTGMGVGGFAEVTLINHGSAVTVTGYYRYGPEPSTAADHWYVFNYDGQIGAQLAGSAITLALRDGSRGDDDLTSNGVIVDPGGPAGSGASSGGGFAGLESDGNLAVKLNERLYRQRLRTRYVTEDAHKTSATQHPQADPFWSAVLPQQGPWESTPVVVTPTDLIDLTNAESVHAVDYLTSSGQRVGVAFGAWTAGAALYDHTKATCDRLVGGRLTHIQVTSVALADGLEVPVVLTKLEHPDGAVDYAIPLTVSMTSSGYHVNSQFTPDQYVLPTNTEAVATLQVWAVSPHHARMLVREILGQLNELGRVTYRTKDAPPILPAVYVVGHTMTSEGLTVDVRSTTSKAHTVTFSGTLATTETDAQAGNRTSFAHEVTLPALPPSELHQVTLPVGPIYDAALTAAAVVTSPEWPALDRFYAADGAWSYAAGPRSRVDMFEVFATDATSMTEQWVIGRQAYVEGRTADYLTLMRYLRPGGQPVDLSAYNGLTLRLSGEGRWSVAVEQMTKQGLQTHETRVALTPSSRLLHLPFADLAATHDAAPFDPSAVTAIFVRADGNVGAQEVRLLVSEGYFTGATSVDIATESSLPTGYALHEAYPNPATQHTTVSYAVPEPTTVTITLHDSLGRRVKTLFSGPQTTGVYRVHIDTDGLASGGYVYRMETPTFSTDKFMIVYR